MIPGPIGLDEMRAGLDAGGRQRLRAWAIPAAVLVFALLSAGAAQADGTGPERRAAVGPRTENTLYVVAASHLDTQWWWTIQETIADLVPATFADTFDQLDRYPEYDFSWEGAFRYMLLKEYYPELYDRLKRYVASGRWSPGGSAVEAGDVNLASPESLVRQFLYGNGFFEQEFGRTSLDVFLPDCFGFGWTLPSVAAHCGLKGFSTQKLDWGSAAGVPFPIGFWEGPDGNGLVAALEPGAYVNGIDTDLSRDADWLSAIEEQARVSGVRAAYRYFGVGDRGGAVREESLEWLRRGVNGDGPVTVRSVRSDQLFRDLTGEQVHSLPRYRGELLLTQHGTGSYTSQAAMKRFNRRNELLADAAERASVAAEWLGGAKYPKEKLTDAWIRFLWHQFHDDLTGTGIPAIYPFSWNDELLSLKRFGSALSEAVGAVSRALDRSVRGVPLIVFNPLSIEREDVVEAVVRFDGAAPGAVRVFGPDDDEVPSQVLGMRGDRQDALDILFLARVPPVGFAVYDLRASETPCDIETGLRATESSLRNPRYDVEIDDHGDISAIRDRAAGRELLSAPSRLQMFDDISPVYPAWEILWSELEKGPRRSVEGPVRVRVVERGPVRVALEVRRCAAGSTFVQRIGLAAGGAGERVEVDTGLAWNTRNTLLKASFPLAVENDTAAYDLGTAVIERGNATESLYEVPARQWADITNRDNDYGVSVLNDCKYGWDKPSDNTLRLTLLHVPGLPDDPFDRLLYQRHFRQTTQDLGRHRLLYALYGHEGGRREGTAWQAARLNQPLIAFQAPPGAPGGKATRTLSLARSSTEAIAIKAIKKAEQGESFIVRVNEIRGEPAKDVRLSMGNGIASAKEVNGSEKEIAPATLRDGEIVFDMRPFQMRAFTVTLESPRPARRLSAVPGSIVVDLPLDMDVVSADHDRGDGLFDDEEGIAYPAELFPEEIVDDGVRFELGSTKPGADNALGCRGQRIPLPDIGGDTDDSGERLDYRLYILAAALEDTGGEFTVGGRSVELDISKFTGMVGQWDRRVMDGEKLLEIEPGFVEPDVVAWYGTHRHAREVGGARPAARPNEGVPPGGDTFRPPTCGGAGFCDDPYRFVYLFRYSLPIPGGARELVLPDNDKIRIFAASISANPNHRTAPAGVLYDGFDPLSRPFDPSAPADADLSVSGSGCLCGVPSPSGSPYGPAAAVVLLALAVRCRRRRARRFTGNPRLE
jgi:alpha-mannosidase